MLILTRKIGETVMIGDDIEVSVKEIGRGPHKMEVRIGIEAPRHIEIFRREIWEERRAGREQGAKR